MPDSATMDRSCNEPHSGSLPHEANEYQQDWERFDDEADEEDKDTSTEKTHWTDRSIPYIKLIVALLTSSVVLVASIISRITVLLMTSQVRENRTVKPCNQVSSEVKIPDIEKVAWMWAIFFAYATPEILTIVKSVCRNLFEKTEKARVEPCNFLIVLVLEIVQGIGTGLICYVVLPELDVVKGAMVGSSLCLIPALLQCILVFQTKTEDSEKNWWRIIRIVLSVLPLVAQTSAWIYWMVVRHSTHYYIVPIAALMVSIGWWENYIDKNFPIQMLVQVKERLQETRYRIYSVIPLFKLIIVFVTMCLTAQLLHGIDWKDLFTHFSESFGHHDWNISIESNTSLTTLTSTPSVLQTSLDFNRTKYAIFPEEERGDEDLFDAEELESKTDTTPPPTVTFESSAFTSASTPIPVLTLKSQRGALGTLVVNILASLCSYYFGMYACKIRIQPLSFSLPSILVEPGLILTVFLVCNSYNHDVCIFNGVLPSYVFWDCSNGRSFSEYVADDHVWVWILWFVSGAWITRKIWTSKCKKLAPSEDIFMTQMYSSIFVNQGMLLNRKREENDNASRSRDDEKENEPNKTATSPANHFDFRDEEYDTVPKIYACATMWHEDEEEMHVILTSIFRLDEDQGSRKVAQSEWRKLQKVEACGVQDQDYYEVEANIFFDDAFKPVEASTKEEIDSSLQSQKSVNDYVKTFVSLMMSLSSKLQPGSKPLCYATPYGRRLEWTLRYGTRLVCHLKDKSLIRHRKRWSQVMYLCYLLGFKFAALQLGDANRKKTIKENTFILALDGDTGFKPEAVRLLMDLMKKDLNVGAACGRIHPTGSGYIQWYQQFEYAVGHWLQKSTEHVIGCVLCSPGCFSLFRASSLMKVANTYKKLPTKPVHHLQYDQGEDRWLCTLLLQHGFRVEYAAASDAFTKCPETFDEFYNQRRRWVVSTMANILELLLKHKNTVEKNSSISMLYIIYQFVLLFGSILGPSTIVLMLSGSLSIAFQGLSMTAALSINIVPLIFYMLVCYKCKQKWQLLFAKALTVFYCLTMLAVLVSIIIEIIDKKFSSPTGVLFVALFGSFIVCGLLHPKEWRCLFSLPVYYLTVPSMYLLLMIYAIFNLNDGSWGTRDTSKESEAKAGGQEATDVPTESSGQTFITKLLREKFNFGISKPPKSFCKNENPTVDVELDARETESTTSLTPQTPSGSIWSSKSEGSASSQQSADKQTLPEEKAEEAEWLKDFHGFDVHELEEKELEFWENLTTSESYLKPLNYSDKEKEGIAEGLLQLRATVIFTFLFVSTMFSVFVLLLQSHKETIHINWGGEKMEPVAFILVILFGLLLIFQFSMMLVHRFETFSLLLSQVSLSGGEATSKLEMFYQLRLLPLASHLCSSRDEKQTDYQDLLDFVRECQSTGRRLARKRESLGALAQRRNAIHSEPTNDFDFRLGFQSPSIADRVKGKKKTKLMAAINSMSTRLRAATLLSQHHTDEKRDSEGQLESFEIGQVNDEFIDIDIHQDGHSHSDT